MPINENIKPTRMELKKAKEQMNLTKKGFELLRDKNDALVAELSKTRKDLESKKNATGLLMDDAYRKLDLASSRLGLANIKYLAISSRPSKDVDIIEKKIMGVKIKHISFESFERNFMERGYNIHDSNMSLDNAALSFENTLPSLLEIGEKEHNMRTISEEVKKTNRKVNSLETLIIPELFSDIKTITSKLEERGREEFTRIKKVKAKVSR